MSANLKGAMVDLIDVFHKYSGKEGDKYTLTKLELKNLLKNELGEFLEVRICCLIKNYFFLLKLTWIMYNLNVLSFNKGKSPWFQKNLMLSQFQLHFEKKYFICFEVEFIQLYNVGQQVDTWANEENMPMSKVEVISWLCKLKMTSSIIMICTWGN